MHRIRLITVGKIKTPWIAEGCGLYASRLRHYCAFEQEVVEAGDPEKEETRILKILGRQTDPVILLDERGRETDSKAFAGFIRTKRDAGTGLVFVIGGAYGLGEKVRKLGGTSLSLSQMTLPHELAQLVFLEQLFRAHSINAGTGYHH